MSSVPSIPMDFRIGTPVNGQVKIGPEFQLWLERLRRSTGVVGGEEQTIGFASYFDDVRAPSFANYAQQTASMLAFAAYPETSPSFTAFASYSEDVSAMGFADYSEGQAAISGQPANYAHDETQQGYADYGQWRGLDFAIY